MKNSFSTFLLFIAFTISSFAQVNLIGDPDISDFPNIDFIIHNRNPNDLEKKSFNFSEFVNDIQVKSDSFDIKRIDNNDSIKKNKSVIILIETLKHSARKEQNHTFYKAISEALPKVVKPGDQFKIVAFSLKNGKENILKDINNEFSDDYSKLISDLNAHETPTNSFTDKQASNIYGAIIEAVNQLDELDSNFPKSIFLFSEERHNKEIINVRESALDLAKEKGVVINTIKYNRHLYETHSDPSLAIKTYGLNKILTKSSGNLDTINSVKKEEIINFIETTLNNVIERSNGVKYLVTLTLKNNRKDGKNYFVEVKVDDTNTIQKLSYKAPGNWIVSQFQTDLYLASFLLFIILFILFYTVYSLVKKYKLKSSEEAIRLKNQNEKVIQQEKDLINQREELLNIKNKVLESNQIALDQERKEKEKELIKKMLLRGSFPFFKIIDSKGSRSVEINKPVFSVGRDPESDILINSKNMSRNHFSIVFENDVYKVKDNNSTNGLLLNGRMTKESELNNADIIEIAEVSFTFFK